MAVWHGSAPHFSGTPKPRSCCHCRSAHPAGRCIEKTQKFEKANNIEVSIIGLGAMGSALAAAFLKGDHPTTVWNRSAGKADALVARGAVRASTVADAVAASKLVVVCLLNYDTVYEALV